MSKVTTLPFDTRFCVIHMHMMQACLLSGKIYGVSIEILSVAICVGVSLNLAGMLTT